MRILFASMLIIASFLAAHGQNNEDHWEAYMAQYPDGVGSTTVNMTLKAKAPLAHYPFVLVTGVGFKDCKDGFPTEAEFQKLYTISDSVEALVQKLSANPKSAGTFTQNCERLNYIYVTDTTGLRSKLTAFYANRFPSYKAVIRMRADKSWDAYLKFLYPNDETLEYIGNSKVVLKLQQAGDKLQKPRAIDHWLYFASEKGREDFIAYAVAAGYKVEGKAKVSNGSYTFQLHLVKTGPAELGSITKTTATLRKQAVKYGGVYDGWESVVVRE